MALHIQRRRGWGPAKAHALASRLVTAARPNTTLWSHLVQLVSQRTAHMSALFGVAPEDLLVTLPLPTPPPIGLHGGTLTPPSYPGTPGGGLGLPTLGSDMPGYLPTDAPPLTPGLSGPQLTGVLNSLFGPQSPTDPGQPLDSVGGFSSPQPSDDSADVGSNDTLNSAGQAAMAASGILSNPVSDAVNNAYEKWMYPSYTPADPNNPTPSRPDVSSAQPDDSNSTNQDGDNQTTGEPPPGSEGDPFAGTSSGDGGDDGGGIVDEGEAGGEHEKDPTMR